MIVSAHAGHWFASLIYAAPVFVLIGYILVDRRRHPEDDDDFDEDLDETPGPAPG
jgi:hypothetical protein